MSEGSKSVILRKRKTLSNEEKVADRERHRVENLTEDSLEHVRAMRRVENLPEDRLAQVRAADRERHRVENLSEDGLEHVRAADRERNRVANLPDYRLQHVRAAGRERNRVANLPEDRLDVVQDTDRLRARVRAEGKRSIDQEWDYSNKCQYCNCLYLKSEKSRKMWCKEGSWFGMDSPFPMLRPLPDLIKHYAVQRMEHFASRSSFYNGLYSLVITGVDNGREGAGFEPMNMESCVKLNGRINHW